MTEFEKWLDTLTREQRIKFAELAYPEIKNRADYAQLTSNNRDSQQWVDAVTASREKTREASEPVTNVIGWNKTPIEEDTDYIEGKALSGLVYPKDSVPLMDMAKLEQSVRLFFEGIGDDPERDGIKDTPKRVAKVWAETMNGYTLKPEDFVTLFDNDSEYDGPVIVKDLEFYTKCEHHLEPFSGTMDIAYWPSDKIIGLSKLLRIARVFCKRPQNQERLTTQIARALEANLEAEGVVVRLKAEHHCMISRGVRVKGAQTVTYTELGVFGDVKVFDA